MAKLNDIQTILLSSAAQRIEGSLLPLPKTLTNTAADRISKAVAALISCSYADEVTATAADHAWRIDGDWHYAAVINDAGRIAIGVEPAGGPPVQDGQPHPIPDVDASPPTKAQLVLSLLQREQGATLAELVEATGWLPHTTRAALTGIRKKGHALAKGKRDDVTCYTLAA